MTTIQAIENSLSWCLSVIHVEMLQRDHQIMFLVACRSEFVSMEWGEDSPK
jgi:hypothetical protein